MKKEFITTWSEESLGLQPDSAGRLNFLDSTIEREDLYKYSESDDAYDYHDTAGTARAILPTDIRFLDLLGFAGKRTKVTIEIIPW